MRILHFSDFHLDGKHIDESKSVLGYMMEALTEISKEQKIDLVLFSGDMLVQGGLGFNQDLKQGFEKFHEVVITPLMDSLGLPESRFIFTPGNHDIDRNADNRRFEKDLEDGAQSLKGIVDLLKADDVELFTHRIDAFKDFEKGYYTPFTDIKYHNSRFASTFELDINGVSVGIASLNTVWRCGYDDAHKIALGLNQITEQCKPLEGKQLRIALTHYPISFLKEVERVDVTQKCAENFDLFFCGHSHRGYTNFQAPYKNEVFFEINASGTLAGNIYERHADYKNSFQIIDCEPGVKYVVQTYWQPNYQKFELNRSVFPDGKNETFIPDAADILKLYEAQQAELVNQKKELLKLSIEPFEKLQDFINRPGNALMESAFISCDGIDKIMDELCNGSGNCRLMALSGMGKTRIIIEAFKHQEGVFYSNAADCLRGLVSLLKNVQPRVVIIDNCNSALMYKAEKIINEIGSQVRLVTIYNVLTPEEKATGGKLYELDYSSTEEVVDKMIETANIPQDEQQLAKAIKDRSGCIPYMAILLISAYKTKRNLEIDNPDLVLNAILKGNKTLSEQTMNALRTISLFDPLGKDNVVGDEYDYVTHSCIIHHIKQQQKVVDTEFMDVVRDYENRQLLEHEGSCIRIRPRPLAEWLTESWLEKYGNIAEVIEDINMQEDDLKRRLFRALNNRIKQMTHSKFAPQLFSALNNPQDGSFHDERIAFSKAGSQLFLSMGVVSPVMVAKNLNSMLQSKSIEWLHEELDVDARRNLVWALENICHHEVAFEYAAKCLARLAVAENENIANNATGLFVQLFHLYLSGTKANLQQRISLLQQLRTDEIYLPLILKAIDNAFNTGPFHRSNTCGIEENSEDYIPNGQDIHFYWRDCSIILKSIIDQRNDMLQEAKNMFERHIAELARVGAKDVLFDILDYIGEKCQYDWIEARNSLAQYFEHWFNGTEEQRNDYQTMLDEFAPKNFYDKLVAFVKDNHCKIGEDYQTFAKKMEGRMMPLAQEFIKDKIYEKDDLIKLLTDKQLYNNWFVKDLAVLTREIPNIDEIFKAMLKAVSSFPKEYSENFIPNYISFIGENEHVYRFVQDIESAGYYRLSASIYGVLDKPKRLYLGHLIEGYGDDKYDDDCILQYLRRYNYQSIDDVFAIFGELKKGGVDEKMVGYPFLLDHTCFINKEDIKKFNHLEEYKEILLAFDFKESPRFLNQQVVGHVGDLIEFTEDKDLVFRFHQRIMQVLTSLDYGDNPFDNIYFTLLPKYQDVILDDLLMHLGSSDLLLSYHMTLFLNLGSGMGLGIGPLFQCDNNKLKEACYKYPQYLPSRLAQLCPVYEFTKEGRKNSFSEFFLWLCDHFGDQKEMLEEFSSNMGTFSWCGVEGFSDFIAQQIPCIKPLLNHKNPNVRNWAEKQMEYVKDEVIREKGNEAYEKMIRG